MLHDIIGAFWAKRNTASGSLYSLLSHMIDAAAVSGELWHTALHPSARRFLTEQTGLEDAQAREWIAFLVGLHDIGKASPGFQFKDEVTEAEARRFRPDADEEGSTSRCGHCLPSERLPERLPWTWPGTQGGHCSGRPSWYLPDIVRGQRCPNKVRQRCLDQGSEAPLHGIQQPVRTRIDTAAGGLGCFLYVPRRFRLRG